ncbi:MAG: glycosyltransferase family 39 protein [Candidatus Margulisiibacteriota bacterium]
MKRYHQLLLPAIILAGAVIRIFNISRESLWYDELFPVWASRLPLNELLVEVPASRHPPLYYLIGHVWFSLGTSDFWIRMISWTAGVATIWLAYLAGKEIYNRRAGLWAAALAAASSYLYWYSREASDYALLIAVSTASLYFLIRSQNRGGWANWAAYVAMTTAALFTHYYAVFLLPAQAVFFLIIHDWRHRRLKPWLISEAVLLINIVFWVLMNREAASWIEPNLPGIKQATYGIFERSFYLLIGGIMPLNHMEVPIPGGWVTYRITQVALLLVFTALMFFSLNFRRSFINRRTLGLVVLMLILIAGPVLSQMVRENFLSFRFYSLAIIPFILLLAEFIASAPRKTGAVIGCVAVTGFLLTTFWTYENYYFDNWRGVTSVISENQETGDKILCFPITDCTVAVKHYLPDNGSPVGGMALVDKPGMISFFPRGVVWSGYRTKKLHGSVALSGAELYDRLNYEVSDVKRVWVVSGDDSAGDIGRADEVYAFMEQGWMEKGQWEFPPLILRLYERVYVSSGP